MRTVTLHLDKIPKTPAIHKALGRLAAWAYEAYAEVNIYPDGDMDMIAHYKNDENQYTIGAIYNKEKDEYLFHS